MRYSEIIIELFDKSIPYSWVEQTDDYWRATFNVGREEYSIIMSVMFDFVDSNDQPVDIWNISFVPTKNSLAGKELIDSSNFQFKIFATVISAVKEFITIMKPEHFSFSAHKFKKTRFSIYKQILNRFGKQLKSLGYEETQCPHYKYKLDMSDFDMLCMSKVNL